MLYFYMHPANVKLQNAAQAPRNADREQYPMLTIKSLGRKEARAAIDAGVALAQERSLVMSFAVTDWAGEVIASERMDGAPARTLSHAMRKAYTSATMGRDTAVFAQQLRERSGDLTQWGDLRLTNLPGGCVVEHDGQLVGAVACGGAPSEIDMAIAAAMVAAALV
jgi:glc operon protein GlcG